MSAIQDKTDSNVQQVTWVHQDPVTKSQRFTNSAGALLSQRIDLDPWGNETARTVDPNTPQQKPVHRFTTYERDASGTDEAMHRRYNSVRSRFEQPDPWDGSYDLSDPQSFNRYSYVTNDPVNFVDPTGLFSTAVCSPQFGSCGGGGGNGGQGYSGHPFDSLTYEYGGGGPTSLNIAIGLAQYHLRLYRTLGYDISNRSRGEGHTGSLLFFLNQGTPHNGLDSDKLRREFYKKYQKKLAHCIWEVFSTDLDGNPTNTAQIMAQQTIRNAPDIDMSQSMGQLGAQGTSDPERGRNGTVIIASNLHGWTTTSGGMISVQENWFRTYAHELGNVLSYRYTGDAATHGTRGGILGAVSGTILDYDTGARLETCIFGNSAH